MRNVDTLLRTIKCMCGCEQISDLRFEPYNKLARSLLECSSIYHHYSPEDIALAKEYIYTNADVRV